jgi:hypothetical protein
MPLPPDAFFGKMIVTYGYAPNGAINKKDVDYFNDNDNDNDMDKLFENKYIEVVEGKIDSHLQLKIDQLYTYIAEFDVFMCQHLENYEEFVKIHAIFLGRKGSRTSTWGFPGRFYNNGNPPGRHYPCALLLSEIVPREQSYKTYTSRVPAE